MKHRAFTLIELLVVVAIITVIVAVSLPAFNQLGRTRSLNSGASAVVDQLAYARQEALAKNRVVEVRFYLRPEDPSRPADPTTNPERFRSLQAIVYDEQVRNYRPLGTMISLPVGVVIMGEKPEEKKFSTLLFPYTDTVPPRTLKEETLSESTQPTKYQYVRFKPTGSTDLSPSGTPDSDKWFLTVKAENDLPTNDRPGKNYVTVMLEPVLGKVRTFRP